MQKDISYHNKDILLKVLSETYRENSFKVYGLENLPPIKDILPTNLPSISADEKRADNIFILEDNTILILEYEAKAVAKDLVKYAHYILRTYESLEHNNIEFKQILVAVVYTGKVKNAPNNLNIGSIDINIKQVFLNNIDGQKTLTDLTKKVEKNSFLTNEDLTKFSLLPLMQNGEALTEKTFDLAKKIVDEKQQVFIISTLLTATDKFIDVTLANNIKEWLKMTKVAKLYEEEKQQAVTQAVKLKEEEKQQAVTQAVTQAVKLKQQAVKATAKALLKDDMPISSVMKYTGLSEEEVLKIQAEL